MPKAKNVTMIPATLNLHTGTPKSANVKRRVAGYARVSTDSDEQFTSYTAQGDYYTSYIQRTQRSMMVFSTGASPSLPPTISSHRDRMKSDFSDSGFSSSE